MQINIIPLGGGSKATRFQVGNSSTSIVVFPDPSLEQGWIVIWEAKSFGYSGESVAQRDNIAHSSTQTNVLGMDGTGSNGGLQLAVPDDWAVGNTNDETSAALDRSRIRAVFLEGHPSKVSVNIGIDIKGLARAENEPTLPGLLQILTNPGGLPFDLSFGVWGVRL